jgi:hydroxyacylglutathione hydrolase
LLSRVGSETAKRERGQPTIPSTIGLEKATNPFLRYREPAIAAQLIAAGKLRPHGSPIDAFAALREWKNTF